MCNGSPETLQHVVLECPQTADIRDPILAVIRDDIETNFQVDWDSYTSDRKVSVLIDCTFLLTRNSISKRDFSRLRSIEFHCRRLFFAIHNERYKHFLLKKSAASAARPLTFHSINSDNASAEVLPTAVTCQARLVHEGREDAEV